MLQDLCRLKARNGRQKSVLNMARQAGRNTVRIDRMIVKTFGFKEDLMRRLVGKTLDLVFDRGAIARPLPGNLPAIDCRKMQGVTDNTVCRGRGASDSAFYLRHVDLRCHCRKRNWRIIGRLHVNGCPVDGPPVQPRRRARFQAVNRQPHCAQSVS